MTAPIIAAMQGIIPAAQTMATMATMATGDGGITIKPARK